MAWTKIVEEDNRRFDNELLTYNSALQLFKELESESYFYETEPESWACLGGFIKEVNINIFAIIF